MLKKFTFVSIITLFLLNLAFAQVATYNIPQTIRANQVSIAFEKVKSSSSNYYINYKAKNVGDGVLVIDRSEIALLQGDGEMRPTSGQTVLKSGESKTIYNAFRVKSPIKAHADLLKLNLHGIRYAVGNGESLNADKLTLASGANQSVGDFKIKLMEYNVYSDRVFVEVKCSYEGGKNRVGKIDLEKITVEGGKAKIVKKGDIVFNGKSYTFAINITPEGNSKYFIDWTGVFQVLNLTEIKFETIDIKSSAYKEPVEEVAEVVEETKEKPKSSTSEPCALTYNEFSSLRDDLKSEIDSGGKPVPMASEYLQVKGCVNAAQVVELMGLFNLDAPRLKFAKMAYQFTSDKHKYYLAVKELAYNKNKEALEEFLEQQ
ncbi:DUF4476 domain-containing protein [Aureibacter tunicatorum]|uniref:DUF4476 domain-containing protein n=1 Tax=Aureibacter tunicatorum TaxID=866807 RepID=A0AAE3XL95_9BACT|nr:DUF4476 domain-containing protein [Aureibacter tunicatorum]MDR6238522.1 hypothetical protein [Aureibacter tunicatorum]BDD05545.1 hypothetical protein AUTU_30280 [Aureibacter tunicatorum]